MVALQQQTRRSVRVGHLQCAERGRVYVCERRPISLCGSDDAYMLLVSLRRRSIHTPHAVIPVYLVAMLTLQQAVWVVQYREGRCEGCEAVRAGCCALAVLAVLCCSL